ncbi:GntR family transcriptional regulator [Acinetobacter tianfuensis]|uniref:GntR family transcriptional regulator n=1 Tax=Acinetobacter tianfuensis TaxID=2419603 RepID=A0A3A8E4N2_9GAMM|nr:GntR family transcriptional regulator [Acinetobacter tianfuensis]RKG29867.1 GntR family transcriptional regulator [Acinetobacter tianfuensis]
MLDEIAFKNLKLPRYIQIRWQLQTLLVSSKWPIDKPIPSEQELIQQYGVSIGTIRKAVECLVEDGFLVKIQGKGTFLKYPDFKFSLTRFFHLKGEQGSSPPLIGEVQHIEVISAVPEINQHLNLSEDTDLIYIERIRRHADVVVLSEKIWLSAKLFHKIKDIPLKKVGNLLYPFYYEHCDQFVMSATEQLSFTTAYIDKYLCDQPVPLVKVCRWAKNMEGKIIEYRESYGLAENFNYKVEIH